MQVCVCVSDLKNVVGSFVFFILFRRQVLYIGSGCPWTCCVEQVALELKDPLASASWVLVFRVCATTLGLFIFPFNWFLFYVYCLFFCISESVRSPRIWNYRQLWAAGIEPARYSERVASTLNWWAISLVLSLYWNRVYHWTRILSNGSQEPLVSASQQWDYRWEPCLAFYMDAGDLNSGPHVYIAFTQSQHLSSRKNF